MPNKTKPQKVTDKQKIENLLNYIHGMQDKLDKNERLIAKQTEIIEGQRHIIEGQRDIIDAYRMKADGYKDKFEALQMKIETNPAASITAPQTTERGRHPRHLWQTRRRHPRG